MVSKSQKKPEKKSQKKSSKEFEAEKGLDPEFLRKTTQELIESLTSPAYVEALLTVRNAPAEKRLVEATRRLTPDALRKLGVPLPPGMRISSRYFETGHPDAIDVELGELPDGAVNLVNALNDVKPGLLDNLRVNHPDIYKALVAPREGTGVGQTTRLGYCNCGGRDVSGPLVHGTVCGGAGVHVL